MKHPINRTTHIFLAATLLALSGTHLRAEGPADAEAADDLGLQLVNPVASLTQDQT